MTLGDRVVVLRAGQAQQIGTPAELYNSPANLFVAGFIGSPSMNILPTHFSDGTVQFGSAATPVGGAPATGPVLLGVRPEDLVLVPPGGRGLAISVDLVEELGADAYLYGHADTAGNRVDVVARVDGRRHPLAGETVLLAPKPEHLHLFDPQSEKRLASLQ
jgi:multiple sugar transport system ATP-binding protein